MTDPGGRSVKADRVLESCLYAEDLAAAERFYGELLGLEVLSRSEGRHVFFRLGSSMLLVFDPLHTGSEQSYVGGSPVPLHGAQGPGHLAFAIRPDDTVAWRSHLAGHGVEIESEVEWPSGGVSLYVRDPAGNSIELAPPDIWGLPG